MENLLHLVDHNLLRCCQKHSTCTPEASTAGGKRVGAQVFPAAPVSQPQTANSPAACLPSHHLPPSETTNSPGRTIVSLCLWRRPLPHTCAGKNGQLAGKLASTPTSGYGVTNLKQSF